MNCCIPSTYPVNEFDQDIPFPKAQIDKPLCCTKCPKSTTHYFQIRGHTMCLGCFDEFKEAQYIVLREFDKQWFHGEK